MKSFHEYSVYIMINYENTTFYIGVTSDLMGRVWEHKKKIEPSSFTARYNLNKLVYYEDYSDVNEAIDREKQLKRWRRKWKIDLIKKDNPEFKDLSKDWYNDNEFS